ncbi:hypothetical protein PQX77_002728 [Marasmius sp. AFHP31]|nr:hypothetical protein PQX77_002728 [Marasmius sp. AFHP31]
MPQIYHIHEEDPQQVTNSSSPSSPHSPQSPVTPVHIYTVLPRGDTPPSQSPRSRSRDIYNLINIRIEGSVKFSFFTPHYLDKVPIPRFTYYPYFREAWVSRDQCTQIRFPLASFNWSAAGCDPLQVGNGAVDSQFNLHYFFVNPPANPPPVGFAYTGNKPLDFCVTYDYYLTQDHYFITQDPSSLPHHFPVSRRDHEATWWEVKDYLIQLLVLGDTPSVRRAHCPTRYQTDQYPLIPRIWHDFCKPFSVIKTHRSLPVYILIHTDSGLPVATKHAPKLFKTGVESLIAQDDISVLDNITTADLVAHVQDLMDVWFMDAEILAEYCLTFKDILFCDVPSRVYPYLSSY